MAGLRTEQEPLDRSERAPQNSMDRSSPITSPSPTRRGRSPLRRRVQRTPRMRRARAAERGAPRSPMSGGSSLVDAITPVLSKTMRQAEKSGPSDFGSASQGPEFPSAESRTAWHSRERVASRTPVRLRVPNGGSMSVASPIGVLVSAAALVALSLAGGLQLHAAEQPLPSVTVHRSPT